MRPFLGKIVKILRSPLLSFFYNLRYRKSTFGLLILDDFFPNPVSGFRFTEFNHYFIEFKTALLTTGNALLLVNEKRKIGQFITTYHAAFPKRAVSIFDKRKKPFATVCYVVFLNNAYGFLPYIEANHLDFVFCLYPGGGFNLDTPETNAKLKTVCQSPYFKGVIVTQKNSYDYLLANDFCKARDICFIFGGILPINQYPMTENRAYFGSNKPTLDICFMANKYMTNGLDKGFDVFVGVAKCFESEADVRFHVIGTFSKTDLNGEIADNIVFHGAQQTQALNVFFDKMDIILSPNRASTLHKGAFDGFPTGSCVEAAFKGVALFVTDPLKLNTTYQNGENIEIIEANVAEIVSKIKKYHAHPDALRALALKGQRLSRHLFSNDIQLNQRVAFLKEKLGPLSIN